MQIISEGWMFLSRVINVEKVRAFVDESIRG